MNTTENLAMQRTKQRETAQQQGADRPACPVCGGRLIEIRAKLQCSRCHTICEGCCEGGPA